MKYEITLYLESKEKLDSISKKLSKLYDISNLDVIYSKIELINEDRAKELTKKFR